MVKARQCLGKREEGKTSEKNEEKERDRDPKGETLYPIPGNDNDYERKTEERNRERVPNPAATLLVKFNAPQG